MSNRLNLPEELASLIEKREEEERRKQQQRRAEGDCSPQSDSAGEAAGNAPPTEKERRSDSDRRENSDRRK